MKFILKLLKEILNRVSNLYSNESVDELLSAKVSKEDSDGAIEGLAKSRKDKDNVVQGLIDSNKSYDEALTNVIKWQSYAAAMQSVVDEDTAIQIAEEFEKATVEYLKDPEKRVEITSTVAEDGTVTTDSPYFESSSEFVINFNLSSAVGSALATSSGGVFGPIFNFKNDWFFLFAPNCVNFKYCFSKLESSTKVYVFGGDNAVYYGMFAHSHSGNNESVSPLCVYLFTDGSCDGLFARCYATELELHAPRLTSLNGAFRGVIAQRATVVINSIKIHAPNARTARWVGPNYSGGATYGFKTVQIIGGFLKCINISNFFEMTTDSYENRFFKSFDFVDSSGNPMDATFPLVDNAKSAFHRLRVYDQFISFPSLISADNMYKNTGMSAENISLVLDSLPSDPVGKGGSGVITFSGTPGIQSVSTMETFTVTDDDGNEYSMDNCPLFINDDDNQTLRKSVTLAVMRKGWTVEGGGDYTQVPYIGFTGTQYIDTGIVGDLDTSYEIVFDSDVVSSDFMVLFGSRESPSSRSITTLVNTASAGIINDFGNDSITRQSYGAFNPMTLYKVYNSKNNRSVYDYETDKTASVTTSYTLSFTTPTNLFIGYKSSGYTESTEAPGNRSNFSGRVYSCKIWQAGVLVRDLIPVVDNNGVACMYDKVSRSVLVNAGTGSFDYSLLPYQRELEYLEGTGTQYIDTGIVGKSGLSGEITFMVHSGTGDCIILGSNPDNNRIFLAAVPFHQAKRPLSVGYVSYRNTDSISLATDTKYTAYTVLNVGEQSVTLDGNQVLSLTDSASVDTGLPMYLFAGNIGGKANYLLTGRVYKCTVFDNGSCVLDLFPVLDYNNVPCMYDTVSGKLFYNKGTGKFAYGELDGSAIPASYTDDELNMMRSSIPATLDLGDESDIPMTDEEVVDAYVALQQSLIEESA